MKSPLAGISKGFAGLLKSIVSPTSSPTASQVEASLTTDEQRQTRARLVKALELAATFQGRPTAPGEEAQDKEENTSEVDDTTVQLTFAQEYLIQAELEEYLLHQGAIHMGLPGLKQTVFSQGIGMQAEAKRKAITEGMDIVHRTPLSLVVKLRSEEERQVILARARQRGYRMSVLVTLALSLLLLLSSAQAVVTGASVRSSNHDDIQHNIVDLSHLSFEHARLSTKEKVESHHLHAIAIPRHQAVGMWLPSKPSTHLLRKHRNSLALRHQQNEKRDDVSFSSPLHWIEVPQEFSGAEGERNDILEANGIDISPLLADELAHDAGIAAAAPSKKNDLTTMTEKEHHQLEARVNPFLVKAAISIGGFVVTSLFTLACKVASMSLNFTKTGTAICFGGAFVLGLLGTFGSLFAYSKILAASGRTGAQVASEIALNSVSVVNAVGARRRNPEKPWYADHLDRLKALYNESLEHDKELASRGAVHYDANTGHPLTMWDVTMSHVHPIKHSFVPGFDTSLWYESDEASHRHHSYTAMHPDMRSFSAAGRQISSLFGGKLQRRQCEESDTETVDEESPAENWCEQGSSDGPTGLYNGYQYTGDEDQADSAHLKLGNDSYAWEMAMLEGDLAYLGSQNAVCENVTYADQQIYLGLREIERDGDSYAGYAGCQTG